MTADLLRRQLQATADAVPARDGELFEPMKLLVHGAQTALHRALVIGVEAALLELDAELSDAATVRACRSALQQAADRILATDQRPDAIVERDRLRAALVGLVGVDGKSDLEQMEAVMRLAPMPLEDRASTIDAIHALLATVAPDHDDETTRMSVNVR